MKKLFLELAQRVALGVHLQVHVVVECKSLQILKVNLTGASWF
jgi:hypothetical protein